MGLTIKKFEDCDEAIERASLRLVDSVDRSVSTLLLLSGGSSLAVAQKALGSLKPAQKKFITIAQIDERYGKPGHKDSNWEGIKRVAGNLNDYSGAVAVLKGAGSIEEESAYYDAHLNELLKSNIIKVGLFGIGEDGHVAGILPGTEDKFLKYQDGRMVVNFKGSDFPRITTTSSLMPLLDEAIVFASGKAKQSAIEKLTSRLPANEHPAQLLKETSNTRVYYCSGG